MTSCHAVVMELTPAESQYFYLACRSVDYLFGSEVAQAESQAKMMAFLGADAFEITAAAISFCKIFHRNAGGADAYQRQISDCRQSHHLAPIVYFYGRLASWYEKKRRRGLLRFGEASPLRLTTSSRHESFCNMLYSSRQTVTYDANEDHDDTFIDNRFRHGRPIERYRRCASLKLVASVGITYDTARPSSRVAARRGLAFRQNRPQIVMTIIACR